MNEEPSASLPWQIVHGLRWSGRSVHEFRHEASWSYQAALVTGFAALTGLAAQVSFPLPFTPVPVTAQVLVVLVAGATLGWWRGALSLIMYVGLGALLVPWFAPTTGAAPFTAGGLGVVLGASGGYLVGFIVAAGTVGWLIDRTSKYRSYSTNLLVLLGGVGIIYLIGAAQFTAVEHTSALNTAVFAVVPFVPGDVLKAVIAALALVALVPWRDPSTATEERLRRVDYAMIAGLLVAVWALVPVVSLLPSGAYPSSEVLGYYVLASGVCTCAVAGALIGRSIWGRLDAGPPPVPST